MVVFISCWYKTDGGLPYEGYGGGANGGNGGDRWLLRNRMQKICKMCIGVWVAGPDSEWSL